MPDADIPNIGKLDLKHLTQTELNQRIQCNETREKLYDHYGRSENASTIRRRSFVNVSFHLRWLREDDAFFASRNSQTFVSLEDGSFKNDDSQSTNPTDGEMMAMAKKDGSQGAKLPDT